MASSLSDTAAATTTPAPAVAPRLPIYVAEIRAEITKTMRLTAFVVPTLFFPVMFYLLFGVAFGRQQPVGSVSMSEYLLATYGAFGTIGSALFGFGVGFAIERGQGWLLLKRTSPMPFSALVVAKMANAVLFSAVISGLLILLGTTLGGVSFKPAEMFLLSGVLIFGVAPFCGLGLALGFMVGPNSAPALINLIYLPMSFASGLWIPIPFLPEIVQKIAVWLPAYHFGQIALATIGAPTRGSLGGHLGYLAVFTALTIAVAAWAHRRDDGRTSG